MTAEALRSGDTVQISTMGLLKKRHIPALVLECSHAQLTAGQQREEGNSIWHTQKEQYVIKSYVTSTCTLVKKQQSVKMC